MSGANGSVERELRVLAILDRVLEIADGERSHWLEENVAEDEDVRNEVRRLLELPDDKRLKSPADIAAVAHEAGQGEHRIGPYALVRKIGQGGMGQVWEAVEVKLGRRVALKLLSPGRDGARANDYFEREGRAASRVQHPGVVSVLAVGEEAGVRYIAQELVDGQRNLAHELDELRREDRLPNDYYERVAKRFIALAEAAHAVHEAGVIHRDLKPENILLTRGGDAKITDFGIAKIVDEASLSRVGDGAGTYAYMSPEQVALKQIPIRPWSDVFSLGAVLYEALTLSRPFIGDTPQQVAHSILFDEPVDPRAVRSRVPVELAVICAKALEKRPEDRYPSMADLADDLRRFLAREPIVARPPGRVRRLQRWSQRHPVVSTSVAIAAVALVAIAALWTSFVRATTEARAGATMVKRLSALRELDDLERRANDLWPVTAARERDYRLWIDDARRLCAWLDAPDPVTGAPSHRARLAQVRSAEAGSPAVVHASAVPDDVRLRDARLTPWIEELVLELEELGATPGLLVDCTVPGHGWSIPKRQRFVRELRALHDSETYRSRWEEAARRIHEHSAYLGLSLEPQAGLLPIGPDPTSGLWEFWHFASGEKPVRGGDGKLHMTPESGIVLVLLPRGTLAVGGRRIAVEPFFISKYEMTQGQWSRFAGENPSLYRPDNWDPDWIAGGRAGSHLHPVENVSWVDCERTLTRLELALPTELQWEYAARAGTTTPWWTGADRASLNGVVNLTDAYAFAHGGDSWSWADLELDDGLTLHGPVDSLVPNGFGLFHVLGNVWEWCADAEEPSSAVGELKRASRGGSYHSSPNTLKVGNEDYRVPTDDDGFLGVRPARTID
ncbi:MAG: protein kinase [bacterium]|nr:protein kinase [bacterium]